MDSDQVEDDDVYNFPKYFRPGYISEGDEKVSHTLADYAFSFFPDAERMPKHWHYRSLDYFTKKHGHRGEIIWSRTRSYHLLIVRGNRVMRIWTDTGIARIDLDNVLASRMKAKGYDVGYPSRDPFVYRMLADGQDDIKMLMGTIKEEYKL